MLSPADAALVARDPAIPGLATLLDGAAFAAALRAALPGAGIVGAAPRYLRYKPGANCTAAYTVRGEAGEHPVYARAYAAPLRAKLGHARKLVAQSGALGPGGLALDELDIAVYSWPHDHELRALRSLADPAARCGLLAAAAPGQPELWRAELRPLRHKPERRFVGLLEGRRGARAVVRLYAPGDYAPARRAAEAPVGGARAPALLGADDGARCLIVAWLPGRPLAELLAERPDDAGPSALAGAALAALHRADPAGLPALEPAAALGPAAAAVAALAPELAGAARELAVALRPALRPRAPAARLHGDFSADQVVLEEASAALVDLDAAAAGDPAADLGSFIARLHRAGLPRELVDRQAAALVAGYAGAAGVRPAGLAAHIAAGLLRLAAEPFRYCEPDWPAQLARLLGLAEEYACHEPIAV